jgi:hypothetical protein
MHSIRYFACLLATACVLVVVTGTVTAQDKEATIRANLAKLPEKDRKLAEAQKWCAVVTDDRLGAMGAPVKVLIRDQPVFLCCKGCIGQARRNPDQTLARAKELQAKGKPNK